MAPKKTSPRAAGKFASKASMYISLPKKFSAKDLDSAIKAHQKDLDKLNLSYNTFVTKYPAFPKSVQEVERELDKALNEALKWSNDVKKWSHTLERMSERMASESSLICPDPPLPSPDDFSTSKETTPQPEQEKETYRSSGTLEELARLERENKSLKYEISNLKAVQKQFITKHEPLNIEKEKMVIAVVSALLFLAGMLFNAIF